MTAADIERKIKNYTYIDTTLRELRQQLEGLTYKTTSTLSLDAPAMTNAFHSKVEDYAIRDTELTEKISNKDQELKEIQSLIENSGLNKTEKDILWCLAMNEPLRGYARVNKVCSSYVYKMRDRALKKVVTILQNVTKTG